MKPDNLVVLTTIMAAIVGLSVGHIAVMSIDLGSEFMKVAIVKPGVPMEIITNEDSARKTASIVCLRNDERLFGNPSENCATKFPMNAYWYLTQIVGKKYDDPAVAQFQKRFPYYKMLKHEDRETILFQVDEETQYSPEELLAMILEKAKQYAETFADQPIKDTVITVPSYYNQAERRAVKLAAELGGLNVLQLMGDNAAVALNYGVFRRKQFNSTMTYIMFYDMGATSTTATIVGYQVVKMKEGTRMVENPQLVIKGVGFDKELGGLEISMRLRDYMANYFNEHKKTKADLFSNHRSMAKLLKEATRVKKVLSANADHMAQVEGLLDDEDFKMKISRAVLEDLCKDMFERVTNPISDALKASEITLAELSDVILMGGGSRNPKVQSILQEYLGGIELSKSINTDEAAALGAVYQAAYLGKGFKVLTFGVKEATVYPIVVEFEKYRTEETTEPAKVIKRTLFGRMNPYPQKKVMTFNKHFKDFNFNVSYGELDFLPAEEAELFRKLQTTIHEVGLRGIEEAYGKHTDAEEAKGIKAHFKMDESGILNLDMVETIFEKEDKTVEEESTWSKLGDTISGLFSSKDGEQAADDSLPQANNTESEADQEPATGSQTPDGEPADQTKSDQSEQTKTDQSEASAEETKTEEKAETEKEEQQTDKPETSSEDPADATQKSETDGTGDAEKKDEGKTQDKSSTNTDETAEKKDEGEKKPKVVIVKENITVVTDLHDIKPPSKDDMKAAKKKLADLTAKDKEKKLLERAKNELESFIYELMDRLSRDMYVQCSTEEEREKYNTMFSEASDWLYEQEDDTPKEPYIEKLKSLKKEVKQLEYRVKEVKERPEALAALHSMLNHSSFFLTSIKNISTLEVDDKIFTDVEVTTLEKLINETEEWTTSMVKEQSALPDYEKPKLLLEDIGMKMQALDREVKYLINKAKTYKPKTKPKVSKNKTEDKNETVEDTATTGEEKPADANTDDTTPAPEDTEIPAPPTEDVPTQDDGTDSTTTQQPERNTHDAGDL